jgi:hypothetical protein
MDDSDWWALLVVAVVLLLAVAWLIVSVSPIAP